MASRAYGEISSDSQAVVLGNSSRTLTFHFRLAPRCTKDVATTLTLTPLTLTPRCTKDVATRDCFRQFARDTRYYRSGTCVRGFYVSAAWIVYVYAHWPIMRVITCASMITILIWTLITYLYSHWPLITYLHFHWSMITQTAPQCTNKSLHLYRTRTRYKGLYQTANKLIQSKPVARDPTTKRVCMRDVRDHESVMSVMPVGCLDALIFSRACA